MVSQVPLFLVIAESLLAFQASSYPELAGPDDADTEISADDLSQWRDRINEALQEVDNVGV